MITQKRLHELLDYDPSTGIFRWRTARRGVMRRKNGIAGLLHRQSGYWDVFVDGRIYRGHRLAWFYVHGRWPPGILDHINDIRTDNRIINLRKATRSQNNQNTKPNRNNISGLRGVSSSRNSKQQRWQASIKVDGHRYCLGTFSTPEAAHEAYRVASKKHYGSFSKFS